MSPSREEILTLISRAGKYVINEECKRGMNAYAFKAKHLHLDRDVFLKIYDACSERSDIFAEPRFLVEATCGGSGSIHLVNVLDAEKLGTDWVLVAMELVDGGSLLDSIASEPLPLMDAINVTKGILLGLSHLHNKNFVHRDIKPANIMLTSQNGRLHPKLGDFGSVARLENIESKVTASKHSALYVPPEGWRNPSEYGVRSDIYQVGLVLAELVNGHLPYDKTPYLDRTAIREIKECGASCLTDLSDCDASLLIDRAIARRSASRKILSIVPDQPYVNRTLKHVINIATRPEYIERYSTAMEMCNALNSLHFPNWKLSGNIFSANDWKDRDWLVETVMKRSGLEIHIKRSRCGAKKYRRWRVASNKKEAFNTILEEG